MIDQWLNNWRPQESSRDRKTWFKMLGDFSLVHLCAVVSIASSVLYHVAVGNAVAAEDLVRNLAHFYLISFVPLSFLFPIAFHGNGFYYKQQTQNARKRATLLLRGVAASILWYLAADYLLFRDRLAPRSVLVMFCVLLVSCVMIGRFTRTQMIKRLQSASATNAEATSARRAKTVVVVGGAGYIGSILVRRLLDSGYSVRVLDNLIYGDQAIRDILNHPRMELMVGDCRNIQSVVAAVNECDSVIHLAAIVGDPACDQERDAALQINFAATRMLIEIAKGNGVRRFIFASSCSVYGATDLIMDESSEVQPVSLYAQTKVDSEQALLSAASKSFHPVILRFATVFGNSCRPRFDLVVNLLTAKAFQERVITIFNGAQWRPFIHVRDVSEAILNVLQAPLAQVSGQVYNVGDSRLNATLTEIAEKIMRIFPDVRVERIENSDRRNYRVSFAKIQKELGFSCKWSIEQGILELKNAFETKAITDYQEAWYSNVKYLRHFSAPAQATCDDAKVMDAFGPAQRASVARV
jgi:nucleoside-diphosphate-sugar epimerase